MTIPDERVQDLMSSLEQRERQARRRAFLYALLPILVAALLVWFTGQQIQKLSNVQAELKTSHQALASVNTQLDQSRQEVASSEQALTEVNTDLQQTQRDYQGATRQLEATRKELEQANTSLKEAQLKIDELQRQVDELTKELQNLSDQFAEASTFKRYEVDITEEQIKDTRLPEAQLALLFDLMGQRFGRAQFNPTGNSPEMGFNSPNFAVYMLREHKLLPEGYDPFKLPWEQLPKTNRPENGDLAYYKSGYTMFYFNTPEEFVIGMTPVGILTLRPDFAPILGTLKVNYP